MSLSYSNALGITTMQNPEWQKKKQTKLICQNLPFNGGTWKFFLGDGNP